MASYQMGMTSYAELDWQAGTVASRPYVLCLDCGQHWFLTDNVAHRIKADHDPVCPASIWMRERYLKGPAAYALGSVMAPAPVRKCLCPCCLDSVSSCVCSEEDRVNAV